MSVSQEEIDRFTKAQLDQACLVSRTDLEDLYRAMDNLHALRSRLNRIDVHADLTLEHKNGKASERLLTFSTSDLSWLIEAIDKLTARFERD